MSTSVRPRHARNASALYNAVAVMGDLINSENAPSRAVLHRTFDRTIVETNVRYGEYILSPLTITLGDEFQGLCHTISGALEIVRHLRMRLTDQNANCRFVIGLVAIESPINRDQAWNMMGAGLAEVRDKLNDKRSDNAYRFYLPFEEAAFEGLLDAVGRTLTMVEDEWTPRQRQVVGAWTQGDADAVGAALGITTGVVYKISRAARREFYETQWNALSAGVQMMDEKYLTP